VAILGAGYAAQNYYIKAFSELGYPIVGITSRARERGVQVAVKANITYFDNYEDLLEKSTAEILYITTPTFNHLDAILTAAQKGIKWIFCEKPLAVNMREVKEVQNICQAYKVKLGIGYKMRFETVFRQVKEMLTNNNIEELVSITMDFSQSVPHSSWYLDSGIIRETLSHLIDLSNWFTNDTPKRVFCDSKTYLGGKEEDRASLIVEYDSGIKANINGEWIDNYPTLPGRQNICFHIVGMGGYICGVRPDKLLLCNKSGRKIININVVDPIKLEVAAFIESIINGKVPPVNISDGILSQAVIDAARESTKSGQVKSLLKIDQYGSW